MCSFAADANLRLIFGKFGKIADLVVHHRVQNTSWALVTMRTEATGKKAVKASADGEVCTGNTVLTLNEYNKKKAWNSTGGMKSIAKITVKSVRNLKTAALVAAAGS